jgi:multisubunit Na+/H+ antiporter MnhB subunit
LLILGAPGSGKTTALLELARHLLDRAETDPAQPMPVVFNLSSWAARRLPLDQWLIDELHSRYSVPCCIAARWLAAGELLPLLDGLDEVAIAHRVGCVHAINAFQTAHGPVRFVVCSRITDYTALATLLQVEEAVELQPPTRQQVSDYLEATCSCTPADVQTALEADQTVWQLLQSPLVLNVMALTDQDQPAEALLAPGTFEQRLTRLFQAYTARMFVHRPGRYSSACMLAWLARTMRGRSHSEFYLDRLTPDWLPTTTAQRLAILSPVIAFGLIAGLVLGLVMGLFYGLIAGLVAGLVEALFFGLFAASSTIKPVEEVRWTWPRIGTVLLIGVLVGRYSGYSSARSVGCLLGLVTGYSSGRSPGLAEQSQSKTSAGPGRRSVPGCLPDCQLCC